MLFHLTDQITYQIAENAANTTREIERRGE
jgi:hypothetical protein